MTKNEKLIETISNMYNYIEYRFSILSDDEYNDLACGDGILSIVDDGIDEFDKDGCLTQDDIDKLCEFCIQTCRKYFPERAYLLNIFNEMDMTIALALNSHPNEPSQVATNVGRFKWQLDNYIDMTDNDEAQHINNYLQILEYLKQKFTLSDDDLSDIKGDYDDWFCEFAEDTYQQFANYCESEEQYNDRDEFIDFINKQNILFFEMQYIEYLFNDAKRDQYNRFK